MAVRTLPPDGVFLVTQAVWRGKLQRLRDSERAASAGKIQGLFRGCSARMVYRAKSVRVLEMQVCACVRVITTVVSSNYGRSCYYCDNSVWSYNLVCTGVTQQIMFLERERERGICN